MLTMEGPTHLPLRGHGAVTGGDAEEEGVVLDDGLEGDDGVVGLGGGVHLGQDLLGECLRDPGWGRSDKMR